VDDHSVPAMTFNQLQSQLAPETTNCGSANFHDWHLEVFENPSDHPTASRRSDTNHL
jgi:hypothetical protein